MELNCKFLPQDDGRCGWYEMLPPPPSSRSLDGNIRADWAILGAGLAGLAAARRLAELLPEADIVLVDAHRVGFSTAGRNSGFMVDLPHDLTSHDYTSDRTHDLEQIRLNRGAIDYMRGIVKHHDIDCDWSEQGKLHGAARDQGIRALDTFAKGLAKLDEPYRALSAEEMYARTGSRFYKAGLHTPGCVLVQPAALVRGLGQTLPNNIRLFEEAPVHRIEIGKPHTMFTSQGNIQAPRLVLANNAYAAQFGELGLRGKLLPIYTYSSLTRPLTQVELDTLGGDESWGLIPADPMGTTVRRLSNGRIVIRNAFTYNPQIKASSQQLAMARNSHLRAFKRRFPMLPDVGFDHTWGGALCMTRNHGKPFGELVPGVFSALCQNALGLTGGTISGKLIAEYALGIESDLLDIMLKQPKPIINPPEPFLGMGIRSTLTWKEWQAGIER